MCFIGTQKAFGAFTVCQDKLFHVTQGIRSTSGASVRQPTILSRPSPYPVRSYVIGGSFTLPSVRSCLPAVNRPIPELSRCGLSSKSVIPTVLLWMVMVAGPRCEWLLSVFCILLIG